MINMVFEIYDFNYINEFKHDTKNKRIKSCLPSLTNGAPLSVEVNVDAKSNNDIGKLKSFLKIVHNNKIEIL